jgi:hypothetical protein
MGLELLAVHGLALVQAGLSVDERVGFLLGMEFAGTKITPEALAARTKYYRNAVHSAISQSLKDQAARANALDAQPAPPKPVKPKITRADLERELKQLQVKCERLRGEVMTNPNATQNIILAGNRIATIKRRLEKP